VGSAAHGRRRASCTATGRCAATSWRRVIGAAGDSLLAAAGRDDREVAQALFLAPQEARRYLESARRKLGPVRARAA
jgi:hypothetical protein